MSLKTVRKLIAIVKLDLGVTDVKYGPQAEQKDVGVGFDTSDFKL